jgi:heme/copper-type cytochrome/quinol oxidase subunit 2
MYCGWDTMDVKEDRNRCKKGVIMWVAIFMVAFVVPFIIWGCILAWRERQADKT